MKFINYLTSISGIEIYPMISFLIFFVFFLILTVWVFKTSSEHINTMKHIPLDKSNEEEISNQ